MQKLIEPGSRPHVYCGKCRIAVILPAEISAEEAASFAAVVRKDSVKAMRIAESQFSLGAREAKALVLHVTRHPGKCNRCECKVTSGELVCTCRSLNLDW